MKKIDSNAYGGIWLGSGILLAAVIPVVIWLIWRIVAAWFIITGCVVIISFLILMAVEYHQDNGGAPYYEKHIAEQIPFDPSAQEAVIKCSVCTGEKIAGFRDRASGRFTEVMLLKSSEDEKRFLKTYNMDKAKYIY